MKPIVSLLLPGMLAMTPLSVLGEGPGVEWYEQHAPGTAAGELRLRNLADEDLAIEAPGRNLEFAVKRLDDRAVVTLSETPSGAALAEASDRLVLVVIQGDRRIRREYPLVMPVIEVGDPELLPDGIVVGNPETAPAPEPVPTVEADPVIEAGFKEASNVEVAVLAPVPDVFEEPEPISPCPVLALRPGRLSDNVRRLLEECEGRMGDWITPGTDSSWTTDWIVRNPRVLFDDNEKGLTGLLELLEAQYGLQGVPVDGQIDIYRVR